MIILVCNFKISSLTFSLDLLQVNLGEAHGLLLRRLPQVVPAAVPVVVDALVAGVAVGVGAALDVGGVGQDLLVVGGGMALL